MRRSTYVTLVVAAAIAGTSAAAVVVVAQTPASSTFDAAPANSASLKIDTAPVQSTAATRAKSPAFDPHALVGVGSCAASGCHGGAKPVAGAANDQAAWRSSYVVWAASDPHAKAYQTLRGAAAAAIVRKLDRVAAAQAVSPERDRRCTTCHATVDPNQPQFTAHAADGIGCESCHGAAKGWLGEHFLVKLDTPDIAPDVVRREKSRLGELGMLDTENLTVQAQTCVRCHVGDRAGQGGVRDMNHDMIAAGHPALNFEFAAYKARMPRHWDEPTDGAVRADRELHTWLVGQLIATAAALRLSADRATASLDAPAADANANAPHVPWPEFSEYSCYRCHHALRSGPTADSTAQQRAALDRKKESSLPVGDELWGTWGVWHRQMLAPGLADKEFGPIMRKGASPAASEAELRAFVQAQRKAAASFELVAEKSTEPDDDGRKPKVVSWLYSMPHLPNPRDAGLLTWEEATQHYLTCVVMYRAERAEAGLPLDKADDEAGLVFKELYQALRFDQPGERKFNSPAGYDSATVKALFEKLHSAKRAGRKP